MARMCSTEMEQLNNTGSHGNINCDIPWYMQPQYRRYWTHYAQMKVWYHTCQHMQKTFHDTLSNSWQYACHQYYMNQWMMHCNRHQRMGISPASWFGTDSPGWYDSHHSRFHHHPSAFSYRSNTKQYFTDQSDVDYQDNGVSETPYEDDNDYVHCDDDEEFEVELSEEMRLFFLQSQKHKQELKEMKMALSKREELEKNEGKQGNSADADEFLMKFSGTKKSKKKHITGAPTEQPGKRRADEMKVLYGKDSPAIHGMETAIQMQFDRNCDKKQPSFWPTVPLKM